jgi:hypothetical protein
VASQQRAVLVQPDARENHRVPDLANMTGTEWVERISVKSDPFGRFRHNQGYLSGSANGANWGAGRFFLTITTRTTPPAE